MPRVAPNLPAEADLLCESCGYTLNGLPEEANCPECGKPANESLEPGHRLPTAYEQHPGFVSFLRTTAAVIFTPTRFFRSLQTRGPLRQAERFGQNHLIIASLLFAITAGVHINCLIGEMPVAVMVFVFPALTFFSMYYLTRIAARLSAWEAAYRGLRLPFDVVLRGLHYHAAHYLPVAIIAFSSVIAFQIGLEYWPIYWRMHETQYLYALSGEVIVSAAYLFNTYWIGMRNMMYANY